MSEGTSRRSFLKAVGVVMTGPVVGAPLMGCSGSGRNGDAGGGGANDPVTIWKFGAPPTTRDYLLATTEELSRSEGTTYTTEFFDFDIAPQRIAAANANDNLPDVLNYEHSILGDLANQGVIRSLDEIDSSAVEKWRESYVPAGWDLGVHDATTYGFSPYVDLSPMLVYNSKMFDEAGLSEPQSWEDVLEAAATLSRDGRAGIVFGATNLGLDLDIVESLAHANGARYLDDTTGDAAMSDRGWADTLGYLADLQDHAPPGLVDVSFRVALQIFYQEQAAMVLTKSFAPVLQQDFGVSEDFPQTIIPFPVPSPPTGAFEPQPMHAQAPFIWSITRQARNVDGAMAYLDWWADPARHSAWDDGIIPGRVPITYELLDGDGFRSTFPQLSERHGANELFEHVSSIPRFIGRKEAQQAFGTALQEVLVGERSADEALEAANETVQQLSGQ